VVLVTSPNPGDGKTTTVANVAATLGDAGLRVLVVDCDHRKPSVGRYLDPALSFDGVTEPAATRLHNVWFVPPPVSDETPDVLPELITIIKRWRTDFDIVLLDTPPMLMMNDAIGLLPEADTVLLVVRAGRTRVGEAERVVSLVERFRADIMGVVLNSCSPRDSAQRYGYGYYHDARARKAAAEGDSSPTGDDVSAPPPDDVPIQPPRPGDSTGTNGGAAGNGHAASGASIDPAPAATPPSPPAE
jgi:Mrp family chromosome partitioning ATPase